MNMYIYGGDEGDSKGFIRILGTDTKVILTLHYIGSNFTDFT